MNLQIKNNRLKIQSKSKSKFQYEVGQKLKKEYPHDLIFEEINIPGEGLILDFFIPSINLVVECHGRQHTQHIKHFHKTKRDFHDQQDRDNKKQQWCRLNNFRLIEVYYDDWQSSK